MKKQEKQETYMNIITIQGVVRGTYRSYVHWSKIGSKRAIVEYVLGEYHPESDIDIFCQHVESIPFILE